MVIILKQNADKNKIRQLEERLLQQNIKVRPTEGDKQTILGLIGDTTVVDIDTLLSLDIVENVKRIQEPYKAANRKFHPHDTVVRINDTVSVGGGSFTIIAGPCSVESVPQITGIAESVKKSGANILRGGAFKPRTSPYAFQGMRGEGLKLLSEAKKETGLPIISEIMEINQLPLFSDVDIIQVGARNMQNFELLKELGHQDKPILLKRGLANTIDELLMSAEYIMSGGNNNVILCERGIRTFETATRNTLDVSCIPVLKQLTHLPIIIDPSHATGKAALVPPMAYAATAAGADGIMVEVHNDPPHALCDGAQSITPETFDSLAKSLIELRKYAYSYNQ